MAYLKKMFSALIRRRFIIVPVLIGAIFGLEFSSTALVADYDLIIKNGRVVDGTGNPWFYADVAVKDGRIVKIGQINGSSAAQVIDAKGLIVAPGFIDVHAHAENIAGFPEAENFAQMGVTAIITGNCGGSWLPLGEAFKRLEQTGVSINVGSLVGHNTVRTRAMGREQRVPTPQELEQMKSLVEQAMKDGALGLATGLIYVPGTYADTDEILELAKIAARYGGVYASHIRNEESQVEAAIKEAIEIGEKAGLPVEISHFKISSKKLWGASHRTIQLVKDARARGLQVTVDQYAYAASSTGLETLLPSWVHSGGRAKAIERLQDPATRARIKKDMIEMLKNRGQKDYAFAVVANYSEDPSLNGKSIKEIARLARGKDSLDAQIEQIFEMHTKGNPSSERSAQMVFHSMSEEDVERIMQQPFTMIASDSSPRRLAAPGVPHPRGYGNNARVLGRYVREKKIITLEDAIRKMTSLPAQTFRLRDRGLLREGMAADIVIFDDKTIVDRATFKEPAQYPAGISYVIVNGQVVVKNGEHLRARPGKVLYGPGRPGAEALNADR